MSDTSKKPEAVLFATPSDRPRFVVVAIGLGDGGSDYGHRFSTHRFYTPAAAEEAAKFFGTPTGATSVVIVD